MASASAPIDTCSLRWNRHSTGTANRTALAEGETLLDAGANSDARDRPCTFSFPSAFEDPATPPDANDGASVFAYTYSVAAGDSNGTGAAATYAYTIGDIVNADYNKPVPSFTVAQLPGTESARFVIKPVPLVADHEAEYQVARISPTPYWSPPPTNAPARCGPRPSTRWPGTRCGGLVGRRPDAEGRSFGRPCVDPRGHRDGRR